jgi:hypothetical protein
MPTKLVGLRDSAETLRMEMGNKRSIFVAQFEQLCTDALHIAERTAILANAFAESLALTPQPKLAILPSIKPL